MTIITSDYQRIVDVGASEIWISLLSTIRGNLGAPSCTHISKAHQFLQTGICTADIALETARGFNLIRDQLAQFTPDHIVYDENHPKVPAPWEGKISPVITSCANFFTTADGHDLLYEIVSILCYAGVAGVNVEIQ